MGLPYDPDEEVADALLAASPVFGALDADARAAVRKELELRAVPRGVQLLTQGAAANGMYLVASGRLQVSLDKADGTRVTVSEVGAGEITGEMALLTDKPRAATVSALRDSNVFFLSSDAFTNIVRAHPEALRVVSGALVDKLMTTIRHGPTTSPATSIVVIPLDAERTREFAAQLGRSLERLVGPVPVMTADDLEVAVGTNSSRLARSLLRERLEEHHAAVLYVADPEFTTWTQECVQQCDLIVWLADARARTGLRAVEHEVQRREASMPRRAELVLVHDPTTPVPVGTRRWLAPRRIDRHHHVRAGRESDLDRVARLLLGRGIGVVFGGGGARGVAHIGVVRALLERKVPIDATAGVSIGAIVAGAVARGDSSEEIENDMRAAVVKRSPVDLTLPTLSLASGRRVTQSIRDGARGAYVEDLWLNFRCVSANLTKACLEVHDAGPAWVAVRSSFAVPGLFPPMSNAEGDILVDGGVLDNMPVGSLRAAHAGMQVIGVDVGTTHDWIAPAVRHEGAVSGWRFLADAVRSRSLSNLSTLPRVLLRLTELGSVGNADVGDCHIQPDLAGVSLLDFNAFDELMAVGYRDAASTLDAWMSGTPAGHETLTSQR